MSLIIAIDVGVKNLGLCVYNLVSNKVVFWECVSLVPNGRYVPSNNVSYIHDFLSKYECFFADAFVVLVERQMRANMRIIESCLHFANYEKCVIINARSVKLHYDISAKNYRGNKAKAVEWADLFTQNNASIFIDKLVHNFTSSKKQDDLADSLLMVMYYLDTYSAQTVSASSDETVGPQDAV